MLGDNFVECVTFKKEFELVIKLVVFKENSVELFIGICNLAGKYVARAIMQTQYALFNALLATR